MRRRCLIIGYHEIDFSMVETLAKAKGTSSAEYGIFQRDHLKIDGLSLPYFDALSHLINKGAGGVNDDNWYHITEVPNLAAVFLTSYLCERGCEADFISYLPAELDCFENQLQSGELLAIAITTTFYVTPFPVSDICGKARLINSEVPIIVGGPLITNMYHDMTPEQFSFALDEMGADIYVVEDQGEKTLLRLLNVLKSGQEVAVVPNCFIREHGTFVYTGKEKENNALNEIVVNWDHFRDDQLGPTVQMRTARSCAFSCNFCDYPIRAGALSLADVDVVEKELRQLHRRGVKNVVFIDDTFNIPARRFQDLCKMMIRNNFNFSWFSYFRCGNIRSTETYDLLKESGCAGVFLGIESADDIVLGNMNKGANSKQYYYGIEQLNKRGIASFASFITGFPGETEHSIRNNIDFINNSGPTFFRAEPFWYNHRSPVRKLAEKFGLEGDGYRWRHHTMDVRGATRSVDRMFGEVRNSIWMPMFMFDFWALPYLLGKGMRLDELCTFLTIGQRALALTDDPTQYREHIGDLERFCRTLVIQPAKYKYTSRLV